MSASPDVVVDADGHVSEEWEELLDLLDPGVRPLAPWFGEDDRGRVRLLRLEGRPWIPQFELQAGPAMRDRSARMHEHGSGPLDRVEVLDAEGIDACVVYPSLGLLLGLYEDPDVAAAMCRAQNTWVGSWSGRAPQRLAGVAVLPQQDPALAAAELRVAVERDGLVAGMVRPNRIGGRTLDDPAFEPVWTAAVALDVPIVVHEGWMGGGYDTVGVDRVRSYGAAHTISHPLEQLVALLGIVQAGVLERHPTLRLGFFEAGCAWAPWWSERLAGHAELFPNDLPAGRESLAERIWLTFEPDDRLLAPTVAEGWGRSLCFATDYPHLDAVFPGAVKAVRDLGLAPAVEADLLGGNACRFYGPRFADRVAR